MRELILACAGIGLSAIVFFCMGSLLMRVLKLKEEVSLAMVFGYLLYFVLFELFALPMTLMWAALDTLSYVWAAVMAAAVLGSVIWLRKQWGAQFLRIPEIFKEHSFMLFLAAAVIGLQCLIVVLYQDTTVDAAYYVGTASTSVYTNTLGRYNPYTGGKYAFFRPRYVFSTYPLNNAVWSRLIGVHPMIQAKVVMSVINVIVSNLIIYQIGRRLFNGGKKQADLMLCFVCLMQLFSYTIYTPGTFFFTRSYEGKSLLGNVSIPMVLLCSIWLWQEYEKADGPAGLASKGADDSRSVWVVLFLTAVSALTFSGSAITFPVIISAGILPVLLVKKRVKGLVPYVVCVLPNVCYAIAYFVVNSGIIELRAS